MYRFSLLTSICALILVLAIPTHARHIVKISVDAFPSAPAVNIKTNKIYVANVGFPGTVDVIDGTTNTLLTSVPGGNGSSSMAINQLSNRIYVANTYDNSVSVIDGATDTVVAAVRVGSGPSSITANPRNNHLYVCDGGESAMTIIDGSSNLVLGTISGFPNFSCTATAANPETNLVYVANLPDYFSVVDGVTNTVSATVRLPRGAKLPEVASIAVDSALNRVYIVDRANEQLFVVDGKAPYPVLATVPVPGIFIVAVNSANHAIIAGTGYKKQLLFLDPASYDVVTTLPVDFVSGIAANPVTNETYVTVFYLKTVAVLNAP
jgi:YVTN family beta-propeller protein